MVNYKSKEEQPIRFISSECISCGCTTCEQDDCWDGGV
jgi:hypothetical protein